MKTFKAYLDEAIKKRGLQIGTLSSEHYLVQHCEFPKGEHVGIVVHKNAVISHGTKSHKSKEDALEDAKKQLKRFGPSKMPASIRQRYQNDR